MSSAIKLDSLHYLTLTPFFQEKVPTTKELNVCGEMCIKDASVCFMRYFNILRHKACLIQTMILTCGVGITSVCQC